MYSSKFNIDTKNNGPCKKVFPASNMAILGIFVKFLEGTLDFFCCALVAVMRSIEFLETL